MPHLSTRVDDFLISAEAMAAAGALGAPQGHVGAKNTQNHTRVNDMTCLMSAFDETDQLGHTNVITGYFVIGHLLSSIITLSQARVDWRKLLRNMIMLNIDNTYTNTFFRMPVIIHGYLF